MKNTFFETISAHVYGEGGRYETAMIGSGGHGRSRVCLEVHLMEEVSASKSRNDEPVGP